MEDHIHDLIVQVLDRKLFVKHADRDRTLQKVYRIVYLSKHLVKDVWNPVTEAMEHRLVCRRTNRIIVRRSELVPMVKKLHEKTGSWNCDVLFGCIEGKMAIGISLLRKIIAKIRGPSVPRYLAMT